MMDPEEGFKKKSGLTQVNLVRGVNNSPMLGILNTLMQNLMDDKKEPVPEYLPGSIAFKILHAQVNKQVFLDYLPEI
jgi:hypothetical protein